MLASRSQTISSVATSSDSLDLAAHYDTLWTEASPTVESGGAILDPWLVRPGDDARRGVTLLARPSEAVSRLLTAFVERLRAMEPEQYYQPASDLHHTVLSLFTATADHAAYLAHLPEYQDAVAEVAAATPPFAISIRGVTLTPAAVLAQGFPCDGTLASLRDRLRQALALRGLGDALDRRYRLVTAHMTLIRFAAPLRDGPRFVGALSPGRATDFGVTRVDGLELVFGDWYHTAARERTIKRYGLAGPTGVARNPPTIQDTGTAH
jgi:2'-5' RNA ligase